MAENDTQLTTKYEYDLTNETATILYYLDTAQVSEWHYENGRVTVGERTVPTEVTLQQALEVDRVTTEWVAVIRRYFQPTVTITSQFEYEVEKDDEKVVASLKVNGVGLVNNDFWLKETNMITYNPRPALDLDWGDYVVLWQGIHKHFNDTIMSF